MAEPQLVRVPEEGGDADFDACQGPKELSSDVRPDTEGLPAPQECDSPHSNERRKSSELSEDPKGSGMEAETLAVRLVATYEANSSPIQAAVGDPRNSPQIGQLFEGRPLPAKVTPCSGIVMPDEAGGENASAVHGKHRDRFSMPSGVTKWVSENTLLARWHSMTCANFGLLKLLCRAGPH